MAIPMALMSKFSTVFEGLPTAELHNSAEYHNFTLALKRNNVSFKTKIVKTKRSGRKFVVMLLEPLVPVHVAVN